MLPKKVKKRASLLAITLLISVIGIFFILQSLNKNILYFKSPTDIKNNQNINYDKKIRVGGMVKKGSLTKNGNKYSFTITDFKKNISVSYIGIKPNLFAEGQGAVVEGKLSTRNSLVASKILAKHDENYMPKEVADALKKSGDWNKKYGK